MKDPWEASKIDYDRSIHSNRDAKAWADFFVATYPGLADKHDIMLGWFANAMMAMHDSLKQEARRVAPELTDEQMRELILNAARRCGSVDFDPEDVSDGDLEILREIRDDLAKLFRAIPADRVLGDGMVAVDRDEIDLLRLLRDRAIDTAPAGELRGIAKDALRATKGETP